MHSSECRLWWRITSPLAHLVRQKSFYYVVFISFKILKLVASWVESVKIPASKMAARNRVQYHPPPPISICEGPRIIQKLKDIVFQIVELPLYISILFGKWQGYRSEAKRKLRKWCFFLNRSEANTFDSWKIYFKAKRTCFYNRI